MMLKEFGKISPFENVLFFDAFDQKIRRADVLLELFVTKAIQ